MNPTLEFFLQNILPPIAAGFGTWLFAMKRQKAQTKASELANVQEAITIWRETAEKLEQRLQEIEIKHDAEKRELLDQLDKIYQQNLGLKTQLEELKASYNALKRASNKNKV